MAFFKIIPILGLRNDFPADDKRLLIPIDENSAYCNCVEGENFDLVRKRGVCSKSYGYNQYSNSATGQHTKCLGLFELYDGTYRDWIIADNGKIYYYDGSLDPTDISGAVTLATDNVDIYSMVRVGSHIVVADRAEHTPYCWKHGDAAISKAISAGTEYKFRYLAYFMQRLFGLYSDQTNGDIDVRWSGALPVPGTTCDFTGNQLYIPNDDTITGVGMMGENTCFIYNENSIHLMVYYGSYATPFKIFTAVQGQGCASPHSIISFSDRNYFFNKNYGFCEYRGGNQFPYGDPISLAIDEKIAGIDATYYDLIVGKFIPWRKQLIWTVPADGSTTPNKLFIYDLNSKQWSIEGIVCRYLDPWNLAVYSTIESLETAFGTYITNLDPDNKSFSFYDRTYPHLVFANTDGHAYLHETDSYNGSVYTGYRVEPVLDFGNARRTDLLTEVWFDLTSQANFNIILYWRGGDTLGELLSTPFEPMGSISHNAPDQPFIPIKRSARLHQIKWEATNQYERFQVNGITLRFEPGGER